jgi:hypothetical protein
MGAGAYLRAPRADLDRAQDWRERQPPDSGRRSRSGRSERGLPTLLAVKRPWLIGMFALGVVAAVVLAVVLAVGGNDQSEERAGRAPARVEPGRDVEVVVQDDAQLREAPPERIRQAAEQLAALGVDRIRFTGSWVGLAPEPRSMVTPSFDETDPAAYSAAGWAKLDTAVRETVRAGMRPMIDVSFWAPRWAVQRRSREQDQGRWRPDPAAFGRFATALATRYSGRYVDPAAAGEPLPAVRLWTTWNEPNHPAFLMPQWERRDGRWVAASPHWYRRMHEAADAAIVAVDRRNRVLIGGLSSIGHATRGPAARMTPLRFVRELACVDARLRPLQRPECRDYRPLRADGFSIHPYGFSLPPDGEPGLAENVTMGRLPRLEALLDALERRGRLAQPLPLYVTELAWESDPPDPYRGVALDLQARYLSQSMAIAWESPDVRMSAWYLLRDIPPDPAVSRQSRSYWRTFQTGLEFADGAPKPALQALALPLWIEPRAEGGFHAWGRVGPGEGARRVAFERMAADGSWSAASPPLRTRADGTVERTLTDAGAYRLRWDAPGGTPRWSLPVAIGTP